MRGTQVKRIRKHLTEQLGRKPTKSELRATKKAVKRLRHYGG
jgi:hypothetical protein